MPILHRRVPRTSAPRDQAGVDWTNPLTTGLKMLLIARPGALVDVVNPQTVWTPNGNASIATTSAGLSASFDGTDDYFSATGYESITGRVGTLFMFCPRIDSLDMHGTVWFSASGVYFQNLANSVFIFSAPASGTTNVSNTKNTSLVFASDNSGVGVFYLNGSRSGGEASTSVAFASGSKTFNFGRYVGGTTWDANADVALCGFTSACWTPSQAAAFCANPWQVFDPVDEYIYWSDAAAARRRVVLWG